MSTNSWTRISCPIPDDEATRRKLTEWLGCWRRCERASCRRARRCCSRAPLSCFHRRWKFYPESAQRWVGAWLTALVEEKRTPREAARIADIALLHHVKTESGLPRLGEAPPSREE